MPANLCQGHHALPTRRQQRTSATLSENALTTAVSPPYAKWNATEIGPDTEKSRGPKRSVFSCSAAITASTSAASRACASDLCRGTGMSSARLSTRREVCAAGMGASLYTRRLCCAWGSGGSKRGSSLSDLAVMCLSWSTNSWPVGTIMSLACTTAADLVKRRSAVRRPHCRLRPWQKVSANRPQRKSGCLRSEQKAWQCHSYSHTSKQAEVSAAKRNRLLADRF